jgi:hypothetical protein
VWKERQDRRYGVASKEVRNSFLLQGVHKEKNVKAAQIYANLSRSAS